MTFSKQERELIGRLEERLAKMESQISGIKKIVIGIAIGIGIGAVIFGAMSIKELLHLMK